MSKGRQRKKQVNEPTTNESELVEVSVSDPPASVEHYEEHQGMFNGAAGMAANWTIGTTTIVGGINYQQSLLFQLSNLNNNDCWWHQLSTPTLRLW